ncbi:hypothetical protein BCR33DRAFT_711115 [Rhizoclosmatium globosum]|uniref:C2H2-type domain-containing protein n=1 Tax=Rhizoclosmatium globosum TaxID=329046 RepID=A0A1Y2D397_9FUNG|nr:hypothetical protein BCR33DRAFT_711115 [Rhizoclosmatium globosum]|eukprot:ORY53752.1 hypothetical protein BCR33DRAFT_711115 [Rhizoclosmatium globosum]
MNGHQFPDTRQQAHAINTAGGVPSFPQPSAPIPIPTRGNNPRAATSPMSIKTIVSSAPTLRGPGGVDILNDSSPEADMNDILMTEYMLPDPDPPRQRAFSEEYPSTSETPTRIRARDYHNSLLSGSLPHRDPRTGRLHIIPTSPISSPGPITNPFQEYQDLRRQSDSTWSVISSNVSSIVKTNALGDRVYVCSMEYCNQEFSRASELRNHTALMHPEIPAHICPQADCQARFTRKNDLLRHQKTVHSFGPKGDVCRGCGKTFSRPDSLKRHEKICFLPGGEGRSGASDAMET